MRKGPRIAMVAVAAAACLVTRLPGSTLWSVVAVLVCVTWLVSATASLASDRASLRRAAVASGILILAVPVARDPWVPVPAPAVALLVLAALVAITPLPDRDAPVLGTGRPRHIGWRSPALLAVFVAIPVALASWGPDRLARLFELATAGPVLVAALLLLVATGVHMVAPEVRE